MNNQPYFNYVWTYPIYIYPSSQTTPILMPHPAAIEAISHTHLPQIPSKTSLISTSTSIMDPHFTSGPFVRDSLSRNSSAPKWTEDDKIKAPLRQRTIGRKREKKNVRNIIPNIARKLINYICSDKTRSLIHNIEPEITPSEVEEFYQFSKKLKNSMSFYIGNKDLHRIWFGRETENAMFYRLLRTISKHYLDNECTSTILLSRRIKPSLKFDHLRYRRKIMKLLFTGNRGNHLDEAFSE